MRIKSDGALTVVRKTKKDSTARGTMSKNNLHEAVKKGHNNIVLSQNAK
ncbi:MAG: hypothetical protein LUG91_09150 [Ruminococcus sp.]|nr:hypothetical protein [Ruminococcus sp.]